MTLRLGWVTIDAHEPEKLADFWRQVLGYEVKSTSEPDEKVPYVEIVPKNGAGARLLFLEVHDEKPVKNGCTSISSPTTRRRKSTGSWL